jgi:molybdate transport system permease protein
VSPLALSLLLAATSTACLLVLGTPLAWWLARTRSPLRPPLEAVVALPLVLPPTVLGFYLLLLLAPHGPVGALWARLGGAPLVFGFGGLLIGWILYSLPFVVQPLQASFAAVGALPLEAAATLGAGPLDRFRSVALPLARRGLLTATVLGFAHTLGEFGVVLMVGGNIPGRTRVVSIEIYDRVEALDYAAAHRLSLLLLALSFAVLLLVYARPRREPRG